MQHSITDSLYREIKTILHEARKAAYRAVNFTMVLAYWDIGKRIVEAEQGGKDRAEYGTAMLEEVSHKLTTDFGKGFTPTNLKYIRLFYQAFPIRHALRDELSWTHYRLLLKVEDESARTYYLEEAIAQRWSTRALERQINTLTYERILSSKNKREVKEAADEKAKDTLTPLDIIKDPYVLEFLQLPTGTQFYERDMESAIIEKLQHFQQGELIFKELQA